MWSYTHKMTLCELHNDSLDPHNDLYVLKMMLYDLKLLSGPLGSSQWPCMPPTMIFLLPSTWVCGCNSTLCAVTVTNSFMALCTSFTVNLCEPHCDFRCFHNDTHNVTHALIMSLCDHLNYFVHPHNEFVCHKNDFIWPPQCYFVTFKMAYVPTNDFVYIHSDSVCSNNDSVWCDFFVDPLKDTVTSQ